MYVIIILSYILSFFKTAPPYFPLKLLSIFM